MSWLYHKDRKVKSLSNYKCAIRYKQSDNNMLINKMQIVCIEVGQLK